MGHIAQLFRADIYSTPMKRNTHMSRETGRTVFRFTQMTANKWGILPNLPKSATKQTINALNHRVVLKKKKDNLRGFLCGKQNEQKYGIIF